MPAKPYQFHNAGIVCKTGHEPLTTFLPNGFYLGDLADELYI